MAYFTASMLTTSTNATQYITLATFRPGTTQRPVIKQIEIFTDSANTTAGGIGLALSTVATTATIVNGGTPRLHEPAEQAAGSSLVVSTSGTMAINGGAGTVFKRFYHPNTGGAGVIWGLPELGSLILPVQGAAAELCFVNLKAATPALYGINITFTE